MNIFDGMFVNQKKKRAEAKQISRDSYWKNIGNLDSDVLTNLINPTFQGMPAWPDLRQAYKIVRTSDSIIIGTDGLSDDFQDEKDGNGFGLELYVESRDPSLLKLHTSELSSTWLFQLLFQAACNAAQSGAFYGAIEKYRYVSSEFGNIAINDKYKTDSNGVGVLIGIERNQTPISVDFKGTNILFVSVTAIFKGELDFIVKNGRKGREELVEKLKQEKLFNAIVTNREPIF